MGIGRSRKQRYSTRDSLHSAVRGKTAETSEDRAHITNGLTNTSPNDEMMTFKYEVEKAETIRAIENESDDIFC